MSIRVEADRMDATCAGQYAWHVGMDVWTVSWLDGGWTRDQAHMALQIAELVAINPPINSPYWRNVEYFLSELGLDPAVLDALIDPELDDDTEDDEEDLS